MSQPQFQNGKDYGYYTIDTRFDVNGNLVGAGASAIEEIIESLLEKGRGSVLMEPLKFMIKRDILSSTIEKSVEIGFNDKMVTVNGIIVDFVGQSASQALLSAIAFSLFGTVGAKSLVVVAATSYLSGELWSSVKNASLDLFQGSLTDLKFVNSSGEHTSGILMQTDSFNVLSARGAITAYLANTSENVDGGYLTFADGRDGDSIDGVIYKIFNGSVFQTIADKFDVSLSELIALGSNKSLYYDGFNKVIFTEDKTNPIQSSKIHIPLGSDVVSVDAVYSGSESRSNLLVGRGNEIIFGTSKVTYPDALIINSGEYGSSMIIKSGRSEGNIEGSHILIGSEGDDFITYDKYASEIYGGEGSDTIDYSSLSFGSQGVVVNLQSETATNGFALQAFTNILHNFENVIGSDGSDSIIGNDKDNNFVGGAGNDSLIY